MSLKPAIDNGQAGVEEARATVSKTAWMLGVALVAFVAALCVNPTPESDLFWQLRTGEWIISHHQAPHADMYSWTRVGTPWVAHEWLSFVIFSTAHRVAGFGGLYLYTAVVVAVIFGLQFRAINRQTTSPMLAFILAAGASIACAPFFQPRPQLATYLFSVVTLITLQSARDAWAHDRWDKRQAISLAVLAPVFILWANLHAGVLVGIVVLAIFTIGEAIGDFRDRQVRVGKPFSPILAGLTVVCFAATLVTPYSYHEYENIIKTVGNSTAMNLVAEWASPDFHQAYGKQLELLLIVIGYGMFFSRLRKSLPESILLIVLIHEALLANRNVPLLALLGTIIVAPHVRSALVRHIGRNGDIDNVHIFGAAPPSSIALVASIAVVFFGVAQASSMVRSFGPSTGSPLEKIGRTVVVYGTYPENACTFIKHEQFPTSMRMYNIYGDGGFLIWRVPEHPVFIDSRADVYFGSLLEDYHKLNSLRFGWRDILAAHGVDMIVASTSERQVQQFLPAPDWALVYVDDGDLTKDATGGGKRNTAIFIKREPQYAGLIAKCRKDCAAFNDGSLRKYADFASLR
jgi:hypothetical protein